MKSRREDGGGGEQRKYSDQVSRNVLTNSEEQEPMRMELCQEAGGRREDRWAGEGWNGGRKRRGWED